jgi:hypothetical protein
MTGRRAARAEDRGQRADRQRQVSRTRDHFEKRRKRSIRAPAAARTPDAVTAAATPVKKKRS